MDRLFYGIGAVLTLVGISLVDYRMAIIVCGVACVGLGFMFDFLPGKADD